MSENVLLNRVLGVVGDMRRVQVLESSWELGLYLGRCGEFALFKKAPTRFIVYLPSTIERWHFAIAAAAASPTRLALGFVCNCISRFNRCFGNSVRIEARVLPLLLSSNVGFLVLSVEDLEALMLCPVRVVDVLDLGFGTVVDVGVGKSGSRKSSHSSLHFSYINCVQSLATFDKL